MSELHDKLNRTLEHAGVSKTIYSLVMPETEQIVDDIVGDTGSSLREAFHHNYREAWTQKQDAMHEEFFQTWKQWTSPIIEADWSQFPYMYPTAGASEALREAINAYGSKARRDGFKPTIHVFDGEYEGFSAYASSAYIDVKVHNRDDWREAIKEIGPNDQFYLSHPSAIDGNVWDEYDEFAQALYEQQPDAELMLDVTYVGCVGKDFHVKADYPNIPAVFFSLSKPAGAYYYRIGGMLSRDEYTGLFGNKWFKNLMSLNMGTQLMKTHGVQELPRKYAHIQQAATDHANDKLGLELRPSDVFLMATMQPREEPTDLERYLTRGSEGQELVRVCLTPTIAYMIDPRLNQTVMARPHEELPDIPQMPQGPGGRQRQP